MDAAILGLVREAVLTAIVVALPILLRHLGTGLAVWAKDVKWRGAIERLERLVGHAVDEVEQTFVRPAKDGSGPKCWCEDCKPEALRMAETIVARHLGPRGSADLASRLGLDREGFERRVRGLIEASIARRKR